MTCSRSNRQT